jgi:hypothetical protein
MATHLATTGAARRTARRSTARRTTTCLRHYRTRQSKRERAEQSKFFDVVHDYLRFLEGLTSSIQSMAQAVMRYVLATAKFVLLIDIIQRQRAERTASTPPVPPHRLILTERSSGDS